MLIVDDTSFMRTLVRRAIEPLQFSKVLEGSDGNELLQIYEIERPDLVFSDIIMENRDGISAVRALLKRHAEARVVIVSAINVPALIQEAIDLGVIDFVVKPFQPQTLVNAAIMALATNTRLPLQKSGGIPEQ
ncbi:MAG: response regulator [Leptospiraceae bacterium]|nr:response regulator [Leptospiraceae bacterium]